MLPFFIFVLENRLTVNFHDYEDCYFVLVLRLLVDSNFVAVRLSKHFIKLYPPWYYILTMPDIMSCKGTTSETRLWFKEN